MGPPSRHALQLPCTRLQVHVAEEDADAEDMQVIGVCCHIQHRQGHYAALKRIVHCTVPCSTPKWDLEVPTVLFAGVPQEKVLHGRRDDAARATDSPALELDDELDQVQVPVPWITAVGSPVCWQTSGMTSSGPITPDPASASFEQQRESTEHAARIWKHRYALQ